MNVQQALFRRLPLGRRHCYITIKLVAPDQRHSIRVANGLGSAIGFSAPKPVDSSASLIFWLDCYCPLMGGLDGVGDMG